MVLILTLFMLCIESFDETPFVKLLKAKLADVGKTIENLESKSKISRVEDKIN